MSNFKNGVAYSPTQPLITVSAPPIVAQRAPSSNDKAPLGTFWVDEVAETIYFLVAVKANVAKWIIAGTGAGVFAFLEATLGDITADMGNIIATMGNIESLVGHIAAAQDITTTGGNIVLQDTDTTGVRGEIIFGGNRWIHNYGSLNTFIGQNVSNTTLTGTNSVGIGSTALNSLTSGNNNIAIGSTAALLLTTGSSNTIVGQGAFLSATTASTSVAIGKDALNQVTTGSDNICIGYQAGSAFTVALNSNICIGNVGGVGDSHVIRIGTDGNGAGQQDTCYIAGAVTTARGITATTGNIQTTAGNLLLPNTNVGATQGIIAFGGTSFIHNFGTENTFVGQDAGTVGLTVGSAINNTGIGSGALNHLTTGHNNTAVGQDALLAVDTGSANTAVGLTSLNAVTSGNNNTCVGVNSGLRLTTGSTNTLIGIGAGSSYTAGESNNVIVGNHNGVAGESGKVRIGVSGVSDAFYAYGAVAVIAGGGAMYINAGTSQIGYHASSRIFKENIKNMGDDTSRLFDLCPVTFTYKFDEQHQKQYGLIAEEVEGILPDLVDYDKDGAPHAVKYHDLPVMLLNEIKKLKERIEVLERRR